MAAGDFYFALNATFRFIHDRWGEDALVNYWESLAREYHAPLSQRSREGGLPAVADYWRDYFAHEPGGEVTVEATDEAVVVEVKDCPAIRWLREGGREIMPLYCRHCHHTASVIASNADLSFQLQGGGGTCRQTFRPDRSAVRNPKSQIQNPKCGGVAVA
ncbi:MAG: hypothetical protein COZ06_28480 [Armatimonadetes bacterium CG_4_10_14_3_um_filter_66_18]|nr:hypothetical protein [Armatimonadota bacterium]OIO95417.1 MAG: hypothetical protein AUJ96_26690 [Armatimonadetes bacterium CG2_30_66_41]PIU91571.1 MAG: hypothetical protein COS65_21450 [Armatimonadetes bacterium CG06_land_8_20_14_3_00_66_21]PIX45734.1 MAG: hypothetical protein COZ57_14585 [Armatimonadetes bacterium CG_4_8_14_3_um_filter_66_20]PIY40130.1 MAG: hypothetical protein COZ06_28480 [Armatimonadetes bacterium CG_4_10_14_3_um_filter_66_18]PIZ48263.1 MAG: hypothetical protein COY42_06